MGVGWTAGWATAYDRGALGTSPFLTLEPVLNELSVQVPEPHQVDEYLRRYADMQEIAVDIVRAVRARFPLPAQLHLGLAGFEVDYPHLVLYVRQSEYPADILSQIREAYVMIAEGLADKSGWMIATTDFRTP